MNDHIDGTVFLCDSKAIFAVRFKLLVPRAEATVTAHGRMVKLSHRRHLRRISPLTMSICPDPSYNTLKRILDNFIRKLVREIGECVGDLEHPWEKTQGSRRSVRYRITRFLELGPRLRASSSLPESFTGLASSELGSRIFWRVRCEMVLEGRWTSG